MKKSNRFIAHLSRLAIAIIMLACLYGAAGFAEAPPLADDPPPYEVMSPFDFDHPDRDPPIR